MFDCFNMCLKLGMWFLVKIFFKFFGRILFKNLFEWLCKVFVIFCCFDLWLLKLIFIFCGGRLLLCEWILSVDFEEWLLCG